MVVIVVAWKSFESMCAAVLDITHAWQAQKGSPSKLIHFPS